MVFWKYFCKKPALHTIYRQISLPYLLSKSDMEVCFIVSVCQSNISLCLSVDWRVDGAVGSSPGGDGAGPARQGGGHQRPGDRQTRAQAI